MGIVCRGYGLKNIKLLINRLILGSIINFSYYSWLI